jgi:hypothetical protein
MVGQSTVTAAFAAKDALQDAIKAALTAKNETEVDITFGFRWPMINKSWISLLSGESDISWAGLGARAQDEVIRLEVHFGAWSPVIPGNDDEYDVQDRAFELVDIVTAYIRSTDLTLGGTVKTCLPSKIAWDGATTDDESGQSRVCVVAVEFTCTHRIR